MMKRYPGLLVVCIQARRKRIAWDMGRALGVAYNTGYRQGMHKRRYKALGHRRYHQWRSSAGDSSRSARIWNLSTDAHHEAHTNFSSELEDATFASRLSWPTTTLFDHTSCMPYCYSASWIQGRGNWSFSVLEIHSYLSSWKGYNRFNY